LETVQEQLRGAYDQVFSATADDLEEIDADESREDISVLDMVGQQSLKNSVSDISDDVASKLEDVFQDHYEDGESINSSEVIEDIQDVTGFARSRAENIARTEGGKVQTRARRDAYKEAEERRGEKFLYEHVGPSDSRTTRICERIKDRTEGGVPWSEYVDILREESGKELSDWSVDSEHPLAHYQCRHTVIRVQ